MNAHLEANFKRGFLLTEEALIKLDDIIRKRLLAADPQAAIQFKVFRADGMLVEFDNPSAVAAEENSSRNAIRRVEILSAGTAYKLSLKFDPKDNTDLAIEANDRDLAYLLASDIKDYINSEVLKFRTFGFDSAMSSKNIFPFLMLPFLFITVSNIKETPNAETVAQVLASNDVQAKLNLLIESRLGQDPGPLKWYLVALVALLVILFFLGSLLDKAYPRNIFYWGKLAQAYDRLLGLREKVVWGIVIAFVIGIASTVAVDYFKHP
jgi:uncharacterized membrane protein